MAHPAEGAPTKPTKPGFDGFVGSRLAEYAEIRGRCRYPIQRLRFSEFDPRVLTSTPLDSPDNGPTDGRREDQIRCPLPEPSQHPAGLPPPSWPTQVRGVKAAPALQVHLNAREEAIRRDLVFLKLLCE